MLLDTRFLVFLRIFFSFVLRHSKATWKQFCSFECFLLIKKIFYLFIFRKRGREGERETEKHQCVRETSIGFLLHAPNRGPGPQPRHVPWAGIKPATFWFADWCSIHWITPPGLNTFRWNSNSFYSRVNLVLSLEPVSLCVFNWNLCYEASLLWPLREQTIASPVWDWTVVLYPPQFIFPRYWLGYSYICSDQYSAEALRGALWISPEFVTCKTLYFICSILWILAVLASPNSQQ